VKARHGLWAVEHVTLTEPTRPDLRACLPAVAASHLVVTYNGFVRALVDRADGLAEHVPADVLAAMVGQMG